MLVSFTLHVIEHGWRFHCRIQVNDAESPNPALDAGKDVTAYFALSRPHQQRTRFYFQVASRFGCGQPIRCRNVHKITAQRAEFRAEWMAYNPEFPAAFLLSRSCSNPWGTFLAHRGYNFGVHNLDHQELRERCKRLSETLAKSRALREQSRNLIHQNYDLRDFLRETLLIIMARRDAWEDRRRSPSAYL